jgi:hypothetical protein
MELSQLEEDQTIISIDFDHVLYLILPGCNVPKWISLEHLKFLCFLVMVFYQTICCFGILFCARMVFVDFAGNK